MVEIIPYEMEVDEGGEEGDDENWIPLNAPISSSTLQQQLQSSTWQQSSSYLDSSPSVAGANISSSPLNNSNNTAANFEDDDADEGWQKLSSSLPTLTAATEAGAGASTKTSFIDFLPILSSITKITTVTTASDNNNNDDSQSATEENVTWRRPDELDNTEIKHFTSFSKSNRDSRGRRRDRSSCGGVGGVYEEYNDSKMSTVKVDSTCDDNNNNLRRGQQQRSSLENTKSQQRRAKDVDTSSPDMGSNNEERNTRRQKEWQQQPQLPSTRIKSKLQEKYILDPLRSFPFHFLRNFIIETRYQLGVAWKYYFFAVNDNDDGNGNGSGSDKNAMMMMDSGVIAALVLYSVIGMFGLGLILNGIYHIGVAIVSTLVWSVSVKEKITTTATATTFCFRDDAMSTTTSLSIYFTFIMLGLLIWVVAVSRRKKKGNQEGWLERTIQFPSISTTIPVIVVFTSPSLYEVLVIAFSIKTIFSVVCKTFFVVDVVNGDFSCMIDQQHQQVMNNVGFLSGMAAVTLIGFVVAISLFLVMNLISWTELEEEEEEEKGKDDVSTEIKTTSSRIAGLATTLRRLRTSPHECHALGIITLSSLSIVLILLRDGVFILSSLRIVRIFLSIISGIFVLERLWDKIMESIATKSSGAAIRMSLRQISRRALKKSLLDLSTSALWSKDDTGNVVLGIFSEEDSELRYAILGWILDRWASTSDNDVPSTAVAEEDSPLDESGGSPWTDGPERDFPPMRCDSSSSANDGTKFDTKHRDGDCYNKADCHEKVHHQPSISSYQSLQGVITRLDADKTLIPTIARYKEWVSSLPPNQNVAFCVAISRLCPAMVVFGLAVTRAVFQTFVFYTLGTTSNNIGNLPFVFTIAAALWPLLLIEYWSLSRWWTKHFEGQSGIPDSVIIMLEKEDLAPKLFFYPLALVTDTCAIFLRVWNLLLESVSLLESTVPMVRCATVACATADLAGDTLCLLDLAFEVKKRGLIGGVGMLVWDAFNHHLKEELFKRGSSEKGETDQHDELGGKYTGAVINSARNIGKISQNIGCLMGSKKDHEEGTPMKNEDKSNGVGVARDDSSESHQDDKIDSSVKNNDEKRPRLFTQEKESISSSRSDASKNELSHLQSEGVSTNVEHIQTCAQSTESELGAEQKREGNNLMPVWIGTGLAILGALVGGITVAANNKHDDKSRPKCPKDSE